MSSVYDSSLHFTFIFKGIKTMKRQFATMGIIAAAFLSVTAYADDAQMNNQMGQVPATAPGMAAQPAMPSTAQPALPSTAQPAMPSTAQPAMPTPANPQTGAMPDTATGSPDDMNAPAIPATPATPSNNY